MHRTLSFCFSYLFMTIFIFGTNPESINNKAIEFFKQGRLEEAIESMNKAIQIASKRSILYNNRGFIKSAVGDFYGALADFNYSIKLNSNKHAVALAYFNRANLKKSQNNFAEAIKDYTMAITYNPKFAAAYKNRALVRQTSAELDLQKYNELK